MHHSLQTDFLKVTVVEHAGAYQCLPRSLYNSSSSLALAMSRRRTLAISPLVGLDGSSAVQQYHQKVTDHVQQLVTCIKSCSNAVHQMYKSSSYCISSTITGPSHGHQVPIHLSCHCSVMQQLWTQLESVLVYLLPGNACNQGLYLVWLGQERRFYDGESLASHEWLSC